MNDTALKNRCQPPLSLRKIKAWCLCRARFDPIKLKWVKDSYFSPSGSLVRNNDPSNWSTWDEIESHICYVTNVFPVFVFQEESDFLFLDFDYCFDKKGNLFPQFKEILGRLPKNTWVERSVSGSGLHVVGTGAIRGFIKEFEDGSKLEVYSKTNRFCVVTGLSYDCKKPKINDLSVLSSWIDKKYRTNAGQPEKDNIIIPDCLWNGKEELLIKKEIKKLVKECGQSVYDLHKNGSNSRWFVENPDASRAQYFFLHAVVKHCKSPQELDYVYMHSAVSWLDSNQKPGKGRSIAYRQREISNAWTQHEKEKRKLDEGMGQWVYVENNAHFVNKYTGEVLKKTAFNDKFSLGIQNGKDAAFLKFQTNVDMIKVDRMVFHPGRDAVLQWGEDGGTAFNTWKPALLDCGIGDITRWLAHWERIIPDPLWRALFFNWVAGTIRGLKMSYMPILSSMQGVGKDAGLRPLVNAVGALYVHESVRLADLQKDKQHWLWGKQLLILQEVKGFNAQDISNTLKNYVTTPPDTIEIDLKFVGPFHVPNVGCFILLTNDRAPLRTEQAERRYPFYRSDAKEMRAIFTNEEMNEWVEYMNAPETARALQVWAENYGPVYTHLSVEQASIGSKVELQEASKDSLAEMIAFDMAERVHVFEKEVCGLRDFLTFVRTHYVSEVRGRRFTGERLINILRENGIEIELLRGLQGRIEKGSTPIRKSFVVFRNFTKWLASGPQKVFDEVRAKDR